MLVERTAGPSTSLRSGRDDKFVFATHLSGEGRVNCRSLGYAGFPVELGGFDERHVGCRVAGNPGTLLMTQEERMIGLVPRLRRSDHLLD